MASSRRGTSLENEEYDPYEVALARLDSIQSEYMKKLRDITDTFDNSRISLQEEIRERQREVQLLQQELQRKETELKGKEQKLQDEEKNFHVLLRQERQNRKKKLEPYLRISPAPIEQRYRESTEVTRGRTEAGSPGQGTSNNTGRQLQEAIVIDSEGFSSDEWSTEKPLLTSSTSPSKRPRMSEVEGLSVNSSSRQRNWKRQRIRIENSSERGECSNTAQLREGRSEAQATAAIVDLSPSLLGGHNQKKKKKKSAFKGIVDPIVGGIYKIYHGPIKGSYAAVVLPIGDFGKIGISKSLYDTNLRRSIPSCYNHNKITWEIFGWEKDYDDGGPRVTDRKFPVMSFDGIWRDQPRLDGEFCPTDATYAWVSAKSIRTLELDAATPLLQLLPGFDCAKKFRARLDRIKENMNKEAQQVCDRNEPLQVALNRLSPGELQRRGTESSQTQEHSQVLTLRYSEDDLTPHQTIEEHDSTIHVATEPRPNSRSQRIDHEFHTFESIYRETSETDLVGSETSPDGIFNDDDRDRQLISDLFPGSPIPQIGETSDGNITGDVQHSDSVEPSSLLAKTQPTSGLPYVARAIRRPWSEDGDLDPSNQNSSSPLGLQPTSSKAARTMYTNLKRYVNQHESDTPDYSPPTAQTLPQEPSKGHQTTAEVRGNGAPNGGLASPSNPNIQNTASTALSYLNSIYNMEQ